MISVQKKQKVNEYFNTKLPGLENWCHGLDIYLERHDELTLELKTNRKFSIFESKGLNVSAEA